MDEHQQALQILAESKAVITNSHVVYTSGKHGSAYVNKDALYPHVWKTARLCRMIADHFGNGQVQAVIAPAVGGIILSQWTAHFLSSIGANEVLAVYADKIDDDGFIIKRGYDKIISGMRVLVVEDVITTGGSVKKVVEASRAIGGYVVGVGALCNRGGVTKHDLADVPKLFEVVNMRLDMWDEADCPLCAQDVPINTDVGKGREFLERKMLYAA